MDDSALKVIDDLGKFYSPEVMQEYADDIAAFRQRVADGDTTASASVGELLFKLEKGRLAKIREV